MGDGSVRSRSRYAGFALVGGGLASATAAETLRLKGATGSILMLCVEDVRPFHQAPSSKQFPLGASHDAPSFINRRIIVGSTEHAEAGKPSYREYDFPRAIAAKKSEGYLIAKQAIGRLWSGGIGHADAF